MNTGDWVDTPMGIGRLGHISEGNKNAYVWLGIEVYAFALDLVTPIPKAVADILRSVN